MLQRTTSATLANQWVKAARAIVRALKQDVQATTQKRVHIGIHTIESNYQGIQMLDPSYHLQYANYIELLKRIISLKLKSRALEDIGVPLDDATRVIFEAAVEEFDMSPPSYQRVVVQKNRRPVQSPTATAKLRKDIDDREKVEAASYANAMRTSWVIAASKIFQRADDAALRAETAEAKAIELEAAATAARKEADKLHDLAVKEAQKADIDFKRTIASNIAK